MKLKKIISVLVFSSILMTTFPVKKAEAGIVVAAGSLTMTFVGMDQHWKISKNDFNGDGSIYIGTPVFLAGGVVALVGTFIANPLLIVLSEDGSLSHSDLENVLTERYSFLNDREVISGLASALKLKVKAQKPERNGTTLISLSEAEVKAILAPLDLKSVEIATVINDLK